MTDLNCRHCGTPLEVSVVDLGVTPLANSYVRPDAAPAADPRFELHARLCTDCNLVQVRNAVDPEEIFSDYAYFSSYSSSWLDHARRFVEMAIERFAIGTDELVVEVASNDGYLLKNFVERGIPVRGIEPAANVAEAAEAAGVTTTVAFFNEELARELVAESGHPRLIVGNNVFAHVPDINDFSRGLATLAGENGVVVLEFPHLGELITHTQFDTIYHEHFSYLSLAATQRILGAAGLEVFDVERLKTHGGSLRIFASQAGSRAKSDQIGELRRHESDLGLAEPATYSAFTTRVERIREQFTEFLRQARADGATVAAYGAAAKGNTLLNYCGVTESDIAMVADRNPHKQGLLMPGSRIPIVSPEDLERAAPEYVVILPWNLRSEIVGQLGALGMRGASFVTAVPELTTSP